MAAHVSYCERALHGGRRLRPALALAALLGVTWAAGPARAVSMDAALEAADTAAYVAPAADLPTQGPGLAADDTPAPAALDDANSHPDARITSAGGPGTAPAIHAALAELPVSGIVLSEHAAAVTQGEGDPSASVPLSQLGSADLQPLRARPRQARSRGARSPRQGGAGDGLMGLLEPLVTDLLKASLSEEAVVNGKVVFSVFGHGAFILEAARDGLGFALSELNSGARMVFGADPARAGARAPVNWSTDGAHGDSIAFAALDLAEPTLINESVRFAAGLYEGVLDGLQWLAREPLLSVLLMLVILPLLVASVAYRRMAAAGHASRPPRRRHAHSNSRRPAHEDAEPQPAGSPEPGGRTQVQTSVATPLRQAAEPAQGVRVRRRRRRRRHRRFRFLRLRRLAPWMT